MRNVFQKNFSSGLQFTEVNIDIINCKEKQPLKTNVNGFFPLSSAKSLSCYKTVYKL